MTLSQDAHKKLFNGFFASNQLSAISFFSFSKIFLICVSNNFRFLFVSNLFSTLFAFCVDSIVLISNFKILLINQ